MIGSRHRAREVALQALYCYDMLEHKDRELAFFTLAEAEAPEEAKAFARELLEGVLTRLPLVDELIAAAADNWQIERLAVVDRNVLRLAVYELLDRDDVPTKVTLNEAIELAKRFSTAQSGGFVNGVLDRIRRDLGLTVEDPPATVPSEAAAPPVPPCEPPGAARPLAPGSEAAPEPPRSTERC